MDERVLSERGIVSKLWQVIAILLLTLPSLVLDNLLRNSVYHDLAYILLFLPVTLGSYLFQAWGGIGFALLSGGLVYWNERTAIAGSGHLITGQITIIELFVTGYLMASGIGSGILSSRLRSQQQVITRANRRLQEMSLCDPLTGMGNSRAFWDTLTEECNRALETNQSVAVLITDIDRFKSYNDTFGHLEGDALLAQLGETIRANLRAGDLACRYGGDEMGIILPNCGRECAEALADRLLEVLNSQVFEPIGMERGVKMSLSMGIAVLPHDGITPRAIVASADSAMYKAKKAGGNTYYCSSPKSS